MSQFAQNMTMAIASSLKKTKGTYPTPWPIIKFLAEGYILSGFTSTLASWRCKVMDKPDWLAYFNKCLVAESRKVWSEAEFIEAINFTRCLYLTRISDFFEKKNTLVRVTEKEITVIETHFNDLA